MIGTIVIPPEKGGPVISGVGDMVVTESTVVVSGLMLSEDSSVRENFSAVRVAVEMVVIVSVGVEAGDAGMEIFLRVVSFVSTEVSLRVLTSVTVSVSFVMLGGEGLGVRVVVRVMTEISLVGDEVTVT